MSDLSVSVVVPVYNAEATIGNMLSALINQSGIPNRTEYIIVDNGSTDHTIEIIQKFPVTLLHASTRGPAAARNVGLRAATGDIIAHLDADTQPTRRWLAEILTPFNNPDVMLIGGRTLAFEPRNNVEYYFAQAHLFDFEIHATRRKMPFVASMNMAMRRSVALAIGGWDESFITSEDVDFCYRLLQKYPDSMQYAPKALLLHRNRSTIEDLQRQAWSYGEGAGRVYQKYVSLLRWTWPQTIRVQVNLLKYSMWPQVIRLTKWLGLASAEAVVFANYHHLWMRAYWAGFYHFRSHNQFMPAPY